MKAFFYGFIAIQAFILNVALAYVESDLSRIADSMEQRTVATHHCEAGERQ